MVPLCVLMETVLHYPAVGLRPALPYGEMAEKLWGEGREAREAFHTYDMKLVQAAVDRSLCWLVGMQLIRRALANMCLHVFPEGTRR